MYIPELHNTQAVMYNTVEILNRQLVQYTTSNLMNDDVHTTKYNVHSVVPGEYTDLH